MGRALDPGVSGRRLVIPGVSLEPGERALGPEAARHAAVLRLRRGEELSLCDGAGREARAEVLSSSGRELLVRVFGPVEVTTEAPPLRLTLIQGLPRGERMDFVVQKATELGATRLVIAEASRSVPKGKDPRRWERIAVEAARQCGRRDVPEITAGLPLSEALSRFRPEEGGGFLLDEAGGVRLRELLPASAEELVLCVGPEGGFTPEERQQAEAAGFRPAWLGQRILRTETAAIAAIAILQHRYGDLG